MFRFPAAKAWHYQMPPRLTHLLPATDKSNAELISSFVDRPVTQRYAHTAREADSRLAIGLRRFLGEPHVKTVAHPDVRRFPIEAMKRDLSAGGAIATSGRFGDSSVFLT